MSGLNTKHLESVQKFVQCGYLLLTARVVEFDCDYKAVSEATLSDGDNSEGIRLQCHDDVHLLLQLILSKIPNNVFTKKKASSFQMFMNFDVYMKDIWISYWEPEDRHLGFNYEELHLVDTEELIGLKYLIERIQILICSEIFDKFEVALSKLSSTSECIFMDSQFDISKFNTGRARQLLGMYRATSDSSFFDTKSNYYKFVKRTYEWFTEVSIVISRILKPSEIDSTFKFKLDFQRLVIGSDEFRNQVFRLISRFRIFSTLKICFDAVKMNRLRESYSLWTIEEGFETLKDPHETSIYLKIKRVFLNFLLGNTFKFNKIGWPVLTKEIIFLRKIEANAHIAHIGYHRSMGMFRSFAFRIVGPKTKTQYFDSKDETNYILMCQSKMMSVRENRLRNGMVPRETPINGSPPTDQFHMGFTNYWTYDFLSASTPGRAFETRNDKGIYMDVVEAWYQSSMQLMTLSLELYKIDVLEQVRRDSACYLSKLLGALMPYELTSNQFSKPGTLPRSPASG